MHSMQSSDDLAVIERELLYGAHNYAPLPVVLTRASGVYAWDEAGKQYIDMMSAYSAVSHGHCHPKLVKVAQEQMARLNIVSRSFYTEQLGAFLQRACALTGFDKGLAMSTGVEAVETALKAVRKWAYYVKKVVPEHAEIITCKGNFHGRTIAVLAMSSEEQYRDGFGPYPAGSKIIPYGDVSALEKAITSNTAAFLVEPIQGEGGIIVPPAGYLKACAEICRKHNVLMICDEIQTGLGRTGKFLASYHEDVQPDGVILGKALGGGILPVSLFLTRDEVMNVFQPGDHGSTFGGNPLAATVGLAALNVLVEEKLTERAATLGAYLLERLQQIWRQAPCIKEVRGKGLLIGIEIAPGFVAHDLCLKLLAEGILTKETHETVIRLAPPLVITKEQIDDALTVIEKVFCR